MVGFKFAERLFPNAIETLAQDHNKRQMMSKNANILAKTFDSNVQYGKFLEILSHLWAWFRNL